MYWTTEAQQQIELIVASGLTYYDTSYELQKSMKELVTQAIYKTTNNYPTPEIYDDVLAYVITTTIPSISEDKQKGALQFLWNSAKNASINYVRKHVIQGVKKDTYYYDDVPADNYVTDTTDSYNADYLIYVQEIKNTIIHTINMKIRKERVVNKPNAMFLILMKEYLIANDFNPTGFKDWVMEKMNITESTYRAICSRIKIKSIIFNKKLEFEK